MAILMLNIDNFYIDLISSKFVQRWLFVCKFYCKKFFILGSFYDIKMLSVYFFIIHLIFASIV